MALTHFNDEGRAKMVEIEDKIDSLRVAVARGYVYMNQDTLLAIKNGRVSKGDVLAVAQVAGIMGAKKTSEIIPMCHPLLLTGIDIAFNLFEEGVMIEATVRTTGKTGVEMEALTAVSVSALTIYDMCKAMDKRIRIEGICLMEKKGGKSGHFINDASGLERE